MSVILLATRCTCGHVAKPVRARGRLYCAKCRRRQPRGEKHMVRS